MYISNGFNCQPLAYTASGTLQTKRNAAAFSMRRRRGNFPLQLSTLRPALVTVYSDFEAAIQGMQIESEEFSFVSDDGLVTIENVAAVTGAVSGYVPETYAIPISESVIDRIIISDVYYEEEI